jgi:Flp pilus assembly protein TadD
VILLVLQGCTYPYQPKTDRALEAKAQIEVGDRSLLESHYRGAFAAYKNAHAMAPSATTLVGMGAAMIGMGDLMAGEKYFLRALAEDPSHAYAYGNLGVVAGLRGDGNKACELYEKALALDPSAFEFLNNLAVQQYADGYESEAVLNLLLRALALQSHPRVRKNITLVEGAANER